MQTFTRGATIFFEFEFTDDGSPATVTAATLFLSYRGADRRMSATAIELTQSGNTWSGSWDSAAAQPCTVKGHVRSDQSPICARDFEFKLEANSANP